MLPLSDPGMSQSLINGQSLLEVDPEHFAEQIFGMVTDKLPASWVEAQFTLKIKLFTMEAFYKMVYFQLTWQTLS